MQEKRLICERKLNKTTCFVLLLARFCVMLEPVRGRGEPAPSNARKRGGRFPVKHLISRRNFLKAAGVTTAAAAMAVGAPAASACWTGEKSEVTILYTNDVHTY